MVKKLTHKNCVICGTKVFGIPRKDRKAFYYPNRCQDCSRIPLDASVTSKRIKVLNQARMLREKPIGAKRKHEASPGVFYWLIKTKPSGRWEYEHRFVTKAPKGFHVHHINGDTLDNRLENLAILSPSEHIKHHNCITKWSKLFDSCLDCGTTTKRHLSHGLCTTCYQRKFTNEKQKLKRKSQPS